ncbi:MAG: hypothetical protein AAGD25_38075 [Cyanobacteria bacterium P01_F01_bin.150]
MGFRSIAEFNVLFAGVIQRHLRALLDKLDADLIILKGQSTPNFTKEDLLQLAEILVPLSLKTFLAQYPNADTAELYEFLEERIQDLKDPNEDQKQALSAWSQYQGISDVKASEILDRLQKAYQQVLAECEVKLNDLAKEPSYIAYAMVAEFVDRVLLAGKVEAKDIEDEWKVFLGQDEIKFKVWEQFSQFNQRQQERDLWIDNIERILDVSMVSHFQFID